jgi:hypothetical protein
LKGEKIKGIAQFKIEQESYLNFEQLAGKVLKE